MDTHTSFLQQDKSSPASPLVLLLLIAMLAGCSYDDLEATADTAAPATATDGITLAVNGEPWDGQTVALTRSGETLAALQQTSNPVGANDGFGLFSTTLGLTNKQVTWNSTALKWEVEDKPTLIWPQKSSTPVEFQAYAPYQSSSSVSDGVLTFSPSIDNDIDLLWAYYRATAKDNDGAVGEVFCYDFQDDVSLMGWGNSSSRSIESDDGNKCFKVHNPSEVNPWECQVAADFTPLKPGGSYTLKFKAKASATTTITANLQYPEGGWAQRGDFGSASISTEWQEFALTTTVTGDNATRLVINIGHFAGDLYFDDVVLTSSDAVTLTFRHALARLSFGSITNNLGRTITLTGIEVKDTPAQRLYSSGDLSLTNGTWSGLTAYGSEQTISMTDFDPENAGDQTLPVANEATSSIVVADILQIPGPIVTVTFTVTYTAEDNSTKTVTVSDDVTLEQGKNKTVNLTVGLNHEVVIEN